MELRVLNYFLAIAREESFTRAAEQLHLTQPTLSRQIAQLEEELGVKLFVRSNHNIILTEDGMILNAEHRKSYPWPIKQNGIFCTGMKIWRALFRSAAENFYLHDT